MDVVLSPPLYFSYNQFFVYDKSTPSRACDWTEDHSRQGFARRDETVAMGTLLEFGHAAVHVRTGVRQRLDEYERVIAVPLTVKSGWLAVDGVDEYSIDRKLALTPGTYRIAVAQQVIDDEQEQIDLFLSEFGGKPVRSEILVADTSLKPSTQLLETAEIPDV